MESDSKVNGTWEKIIISIWHYYSVRPKHSEGYLLVTRNTRPADISTAIFNVLRLPKIIRPSPKLDKDFLATIGTNLAYNLVAWLVNSEKEGGVL